MLKWNRIFAVHNLIWAIYASLLGVLLPHTAWAFDRFQSPSHGRLAWMLAFVFEASIFALTHGMVGRIEKSARLRLKDGESRMHFGWRKFGVAYMNFDSLGVLATCSVSALANWTYTVEFGQAVRVFGEYSLSPTLYHIAFGGILPFVSLVFAHILARPAPDEHQANESEVRLKALLKEEKKTSERLRQQLKSLQSEFDRLHSQSELLRRIFAGEKRDRIVAARMLFPDANGAAIAAITKAAPSYVSSVLAEAPKNGHKGG